MNKDTLVDINKVLSQFNDLKDKVSRCNNDFLLQNEKNENEISKLREEYTASKNETQTILNEGFVNILDGVKQIEIQSSLRFDALTAIIKDHDEKINKLLVMGEEHGKIINSIEDKTIAINTLVNKHYDFHKEAYHNLIEDINICLTKIEDERKK